MSASFTWFAQHEARLAWRDWLSMMTAGRRGRGRTVAIGILVFLALMHLLAFAVVGRASDVGTDPDTSTLVVITGCALLSWSLMVSQAMETVTRAFYARADLDLILSSPAAVQKLFAVRIATMAATVSAMALLLAAPFIDILAVFGGPRWLAAYGVVIAMGATAAAFAVGLTVLLFRVIGPKRTRLIAQIVAAVVGAVFVIGLQVAAIVSYGTLSRLAFLESETILAYAPGAGSILWWPAHAILGDMRALGGVLVVSALVLGAAIAMFAARFGDDVIAASSVSMGAAPQRRSASFRRTSPSRALRRKEWTLLARDPWLLSQTLMQILYLIPPAVLLWRSYGEGGAVLVLVPVLVMAAGQLAGGLAWLVISGEDAPDLIAAAPVAAGQVVRAKIEAVTGGIAMVFLPFIVVLVLLSPWHAVSAAVGVALAAISATAIQFWFRAQARRSHFRRRQTSSRIATFAEAFSSIAWAATAALAAAGTWFALIPSTLAAGILLGARAISPHKTS